MSKCNDTYDKFIVKNIMNYTVVGNSDSVTSISPLVSTFPHYMQYKKTQYHPHKVAKAKRRWCGLVAIGVLTLITAVSTQGADKHFSSSNILESDTIRALQYLLGFHFPHRLTYTATMETDITHRLQEEEKYFANIPNTRWTFVSANKTPDGSKVAALNQAKPIGPALMTSVSPGDTLYIHTWAYYEAGSGYNKRMPLASIISAVSGAYGGSPTGSEQARQTFGAFNNALTAFGTGNGGSDTAPNAHLNYILFNRDMMPIQHGFVPVTSAARNNPDKERVALDPLNIAIEGILYVYVSNTSASDHRVYFDDLTITHHTSPVVYANDHYPFGLPMAGRQITRERYRYDYQGQYAEKDEETGWNYFMLRDYDPVIGRWLSTDPYGQYWSPYLGMGNNPGNRTEPDGGLDDIYYNSKTGKTKVVETDLADRLWIDGNYIGFTGGQDGAWKQWGLDNVSVFSDYSLFFNDQFGDRLLNDNFFAQQMKSLGSRELQGNLFTARTRQAINTYGTQTALTTISVPLAIIGAGEAIGAFNLISNTGGLQGAIYQQSSRKQLVNLFKGQFRIEKGVESIPKAIQRIYGIKLPGPIQKPWHMVIRGKEIPLNPFNPLWKLF